MTDTIDDVAAAAQEEPVVPALDEQGVAEQLVSQARAKGIELVGRDGLLSQLTKRVLEAALEAEMSDHLGYDKHDRAGRNHANSRNGVRAKTVLTEIGPVEIDVPRDVDASFAPEIVKKRQRRLTGVDQIVLSLSARGLTPVRSRRTSPRSTAPRCRGRQSPRSPTRCWRRWPRGPTGRWMRGGF